MPFKRTVLGEFASAEVTTISFQSDVNIVKVAGVVALLPKFLVAGGTEIGSPRFSGN